MCVDNKIFATKFQIFFPEPLNGEDVKFNKHMNYSEVVTKLVLVMAKQYALL